MASVYIDVREPREFKADQMPGAINIPLSDLLKNSSQLHKLDKNKQYVLFCNSGTRSNVAGKLFIANGFKNVSNGYSQQIIEANQL